MELHKQTNLLLENLHSRALFQADQMKRKVEEKIASFRLFELTSSLTEITRQNEELEFIILTDHDNNIVVHTADASRQQTEYHDGDYPDRLILEVDKSTPMRQDWSDTKVGQALQNAKAIQYKMPVEVGNRRWGQLILSYSLSKLQTEVNRSEQENAAVIKGHTIRSLITASSILLITFLIISSL